VVATLLALLALPAEAKGEGKPCNIVYIGNSITYGALHKDRIKTAPPITTSAMVAKSLGSEVEFRNCARSGATTYDFLPEGGRDWPKVAQALKEFKPKSEAGEIIVFSIMLGTNDSAIDGTTTGSPVSRADYKNNLKTIITACREVCPNAIFVLHRPIWYSPNTYNGTMYLAAGLKRVSRYIDELIALANEFDYIYLGDVDGFGFFEKNHKRFHVPENGNAGTFYLHPNEKGAKHLSKFWSEAIVKAIKQSQK
jgi:lysophospholipase L1-like esterase